MNNKKKRKRLLPLLIVAALLITGGGLAVWGGDSPEPMAMRPEPVVAQVKPAAPEPAVQGAAAAPKPAVQVGSCNLLTVCPLQPPGVMHFNARAAWDGEHIYHDLGGPPGQQVVYWPGPGGTGWWVTIPDVPRGTAVVAEIPTPAPVDGVEFLVGPYNEWWEMNIKHLPVDRVEPPICADRVRMSGGGVIPAVFVTAVKR